MKVKISSFYQSRVSGNMLSKKFPFLFPIGYQLSVGKRQVKISTDKVNLASVAKNLFS